MPEADVRDDYRRQSRKPHEDPERVVRRAYLSVLKPDPGGSRWYAERVIGDYWSEQDVAERYEIPDALVAGG